MVSVEQFPVLLALRPLHSDRSWDVTSDQFNSYEVRISNQVVEHKTSCTHYMVSLIKHIMQMVINILLSLMNY